MRSHSKGMLFTALSVICWTSPVPTLAAEGIFVYGQLNYGGLYYDDGASSESYLVDNNSSNSRVGIDIYLQPSDLGQLRINLETALGTTLSTSVNQNTGSRFDWDWERTSIRKFEAIYKSHNYGTLYLGQGSMATDGISYSDFSATQVAATVSVSDLSGGQLFRLSNGTLSSVSFGSATTDFDGARRFRVRYDTPKVAGITLSGAWGREVLRKNDNRDYYDVALRYANEFGDIKVSAGAGYNFRSDDFQFGSVSAGLLHIPTGIDAAFVMGANNNNGEFVYGKVGITQALFGYDDYKTSFSIDYYSGDDLDGARSETRSLGVAVVQKVGTNLEFYGLYRTHEYDNDVASYRDGDAIFVGARYKFRFGINELE